MSVFTCEWIHFFFYDYECVYAVNLLFLAFLSTTRPSDGEVQMIVIALCQQARYIHHEPGHTHGRKQGSLLHKESRVQFVTLFIFPVLGRELTKKKQKQEHSCCSFRSKWEMGRSFFFFCLVFFFFLVRREWWSELSTHFELFICCHSPHWLFDLWTCQCSYWFSRPLLASPWPPNLYYLFCFHSESKEEKL